MADHFAVTTAIQHENQGSAWGSLAWMAGAALAGVPVAAGAAPFSFTPPSGVDAYRLVFASKDTTTAVSTNISDYNAFANAEALMSATLPATTWTAIGSTAAVSAATNVSCGVVCDANVPIYLVDGTRVAVSTNYLFSITSAILLDHRINEDQFGDSNTPYVWTGSTASGAAATGSELGSNRPNYGWASYDNYNFIARGSLASIINGVPQEFSMYAISDVILVPEPASGLAVLGAGLAATGLLRRRRHH